MAKRAHVGAFVKSLGKRCGEIHICMDKKLQAKIIAHLRRIGFYNITYKDAMKSANIGFGEWQCCKCKMIGTRKDLHGDHREPVIFPETGFVDWNTYITRLFENQIQPLCTNCHAEKTKEENQRRKETRKKVK